MGFPALLTLPMCSFPRRPAIHDSLSNIVFTANALKLAVQNASASPSSYTKNFLLNG